MALSPRTADIPGAGWAVEHSEHVGMKSHANRAGYLELGGCTIGDMLLRLVL
jgi:hypothetical protein